MTTEDVILIKIKAAQGKVLKRKFKTQLLGSEVILGYVYYADNGELLPKPELETPSDFVEVDDPNPPEEPVVNS